MFDIAAITMGTISVGVFYATAQLLLGRGWREAIRHLPAMMTLNVGLIASNARASVAALVGPTGEFTRTPKRGDVNSRAGRKAKFKHDYMPWIEIVFGLYLVGCLVHGLFDVRLMPATPFLAMFACGLLYVGIKSLLQRSSMRRSSAGRERALRHKPLARLVPRGGKVVPEAEAAEARRRAAV
jgi:hypothetical protein